MRNIKFRIYNYRTGLFYYFDISELLHIAEQTIGLGLDNSLIKYSGPMQFTGLYDKNGKEIYEGDILGDVIGCGVVEYYSSEARFAINILNELHEVEFSELTQSALEIIGNIYENPELMEK